MGKIMMDYCRFRDINDFFASGQSEKARRLLMEVQSRCLALRDEINMLKLRLQTAEEALYLSENLFRENNFYWLKAPGPRQGPFCPRCYEAEGALIRLEREAREFLCPYCHASFPLDTVEAAASCAKILNFAPYAFFGGS